MTAAAPGLATRSAVHAGRLAGLTAAITCSGGISGDTVEAMRATCRLRRASSEADCIPRLRLQRPLWAS